VDYLATPLSKWGKNGVVLDANLLLVYIVGLFDLRYLPKIKRAASYDGDDWRRLANLLKHARKAIVTPGIITEACNLLDTVNRQNDFRIFATLQRLSSSLREDYITAQTLFGHQLCLRFGHADASIAHLAGRGHLVITDDLRLKVALEGMRLPVLNFNYLRSLEWIG